MSDDDRDNDIESDDEDEISSSNEVTGQADKRAHHNALERKRRDHIKDSFSMLRDALPFFHGDKVRASRAQILKKAADYITTMRRKNSAHQQDIDDLKKQNKALEEQIRSLENDKNPDYGAAIAAVESAKKTLNSITFRRDYAESSDSDDSSDNSRDSSDSPRKRIKSNLDSSRI